MYGICMNQANQTINISLPKTMMEDIKDLIKSGYFVSISEVIRAALREVIVQSKHMGKLK